MTTYEIYEATRHEAGSEQPAIRVGTRGNYKHGGACDARWNSVLTASLEVKFRQIWVFTANIQKLKHFKLKSGEKVYEM